MKAAEALIREADGLQLRGSHLRVRWANPLHDDESESVRWFISGEAVKEALMILVSCWYYNLCSRGGNQQTLSDRAHCKYSTRLW